MDITYRPSPQWAALACLIQELKNEIKAHFPLSISRTAQQESAVLQTPCATEECEREREMGWSASVCLHSRAEWIWNMTKPEWNSGQKARNNYFRLQNAWVIYFTGQLHSLLVLKDYQYYIWTKFDERNWEWGRQRDSHCARWKRQSVWIEMCFSNQNACPISSLFQKLWLVNIFHHLGKKAEVSGLIYRWMEQTYLKILTTLSWIM